MKQVSFILLFFLTVATINNAAADIVKISGRQVFANGKPYTIKGICYNPVPPGSNKRSFDNLTEDLLLMKEAGINTVRVYSPITELSVLDQIAKAGIRVITGFGYNQGGNYDILSGTYLDYVKTYMNHEAILFWELGNEYNYHPEWFDGDIDIWYRALNNAAEAIHQLDRAHPVSTAHGELPDSLALSSCPNVDVWGMNVYRWDNPESLFAEWSAISSKPMYLSEAGGDSYMTISFEGYQHGENQMVQANANRNILRQIFRHTDICLGVTLFAFVDEWWKAGDNHSQDPGGWAPNSSNVPYDGAANEDFWGIVTIDRKKKLVFDVVKKAYTDTPQE